MRSLYFTIRYKENGQKLKLNLLNGCRSLLIVLHLFQFLEMFDSFFVLFELFLPITINFQINFVFFHPGSKSFLQKSKLV